LKLVRWIGEDRHSYEIDNLGTTFSGGATSLAFDQQDNPTICYSVSLKDRWEHSIKLAVWQEGKWNIEVVDSVDDPYNFSHAINADGNPAIAYRTVNGKLRFAQYNRTTWLKEDLPTEYLFPREITLVFNSKGNPFIAYFAYEADKGIRVISLSTSRWIIETIDSGNWGGSEHSLSFVCSKDDRLAIVYYHLVPERHFIFAEKSL
jgi:hypothetical protein